MNKREKPVYQQLIQNIKKGFSILDSSIQKDIIDFIKSQQKDGGGFVDRSDNPDLYYSLFGHWLCLAIDLDEQKLLLKRYIQKAQEIDPKKLIDKLALLLISIDLYPKKTKYSIFSLLKMHFKKRHLIDFAYHFFLFTLVIDASKKANFLLKSIAKIFLLFYKSGKNVPSSILASILFAKNEVGIKTAKEQSELIKYHNLKGGFKAFQSIESSDMLSTGVTLFVLEKTGYELRTIKPGCLNFVEQNYSSGAFLSGDGDYTKDLEYTFYGLLALGSLANYE